jgi:hypothetical protein
MKSRKSKPSLSKRVAARPGDFLVLYKELFNEKSSGLSTDRRLWPLLEIIHFHNNL